MKNADSTATSRRANLSHITALLAAIQDLHAQGEPVYGTMAARIQERADTGSLYQDETQKESK